MKKQVTVALLLAWVAVCSLAGPAAAVRFRFEDLGNLGGSQEYPNFDYKMAGINDLGQVVGMSFTAGGALRPFLKSPGRAMQELPVISGTIQAYAICINHAGLIGGYFYDGVNWNACKWVLLPGPIYQCMILGTPGHVYGGNEAGYLVGSGGSGPHAYVVPPGEAGLDLGTLPGHVWSEAAGINSANTIVGTSYDSGSIPTACIWTYSGGVWAAANLFGVDHSYGYSINNSGQAVGYAPVSGILHALMKAPGQPLQDLGAAYPLGISEAYDINDSGWVVGYSGFFLGGFLWTPALGMRDLDSLVVNLPPGIFLSFPMAINKRGEIAGYFYTNGVGANGVFKLTPIANPPLSLLLLD